MIKIVNILIKKTYCKLMRCLGLEWSRRKLRALIIFFILSINLSQSIAETTICRTQENIGSFCADEHSIFMKQTGNSQGDVWKSINKILNFIVVNGNGVWGLDGSNILWYLPNFRNSTTNWIKVDSGVSQFSVRNNLICKINIIAQVYCSDSLTPANPDINGYQKLQWRSTGGNNFRQIEISSGKQAWGVDNYNNLVQIKDINSFNDTSIYVDSGVKYLAIDGRGTICQITLRDTIKCSNWGLPSSTGIDSGGFTFYTLPWNQLDRGLIWKPKNIKVSDGKLYYTDISNNVWMMVNFMKPTTKKLIVKAGFNSSISVVSSSSNFRATSFSSDEVAVLAFMGQSNSGGTDDIPTNLSVTSSPNIWGIVNRRWVDLPGNYDYNNFIPKFSGKINSIKDVTWSNWRYDGEKNLGFHQSNRRFSNAANFTAYQWQNLINAGWELPDLYIIHISWASQGIDANNLYCCGSLWTANGTNLWQPNLGSNLEPSKALAPFARTILNLGLKKIISDQKKPRLLGLQWNQWETDAMQQRTIYNAFNNYDLLIKKFNASINSKFPVQLIKPFSEGKPPQNIIDMQKQFERVVNSDKEYRSLIDISSEYIKWYSSDSFPGGDGSAHYSTEIHFWLAYQSIKPCLVEGKCGVSITNLPSTWD